MKKENFTAFPYLLEVAFQARNDKLIYTWLLEHFGRPAIDNTDAQWTCSVLGYHFKDEKAYMLAILRWL